MLDTNNVGQAAAAGLMRASTVNSDFVYKKSIFSLVLTADIE